jgi:CRISPR-associated Csx14 family protein
MLILIASLGRSPGVVTGTIDALIEEGLRPGRVYLATTSDTEIWSHCIPLLRKEFQENYPHIELREDRICTSRDDIYDEEDNAEFMRKAAIVMSQERAANNDIFISLAGGRKTMSAAMTLLGQLYGVREVLHILVDPELEKEGTITTLMKLPEKQARQILHPPPNKRRLVRFPVFATPWKIEQIMKALEDGRSDDQQLNEHVKKLNPQTRKLLLNILKEASRTHI